MRWKKGRRSGDLIDRRGRRNFGGAAVGGAVGIPALIILALVMLLGGNDGGGGGGGAPGGPDIEDIFGELSNPRSAGEAPAPGKDPDERLVNFMSFVLDDVQGFWTETFRSSGQTYPRAKLVLFTDATQSACGGATSAIGPHYCPPDQKIYLDLDFFRDLRNNYGAPGDFAQAYVLAHEVAHHVQNVSGISDQVREAQSSDPGSANEYSIRLELQADCLAGVWAYTTYERDLLEAGDLEEGLDAASAVGDDRIQKQATGTIDRESWTHGSSEQRVRWFKRGFETGDFDRCDTFEAETL